MLTASLSAFDPKRHRSHSKAPPLLVSDMLVWRVGQAAPLRGYPADETARLRGAGRVPTRS